MLHFSPESKWKAAAVSAQGWIKPLCKQTRQPLISNPPPSSTEGLYFPSITCSFLSTLLRHWSKQGLTNMHDVDTIKTPGAFVGYIAGTSSGYLMIWPKVLRFNGHLILKSVLFVLCYFFFISSAAFIMTTRHWVICRDYTEMSIFLMWVDELVESRTTVISYAPTNTYKGIKKKNRAVTLVTANLTLQFSFAITQTQAHLQTQTQTSTKTFSNSNTLSFTRLTHKHPLGGFA